MLGALAIYVQGSTALGTTVKPISRNEHDLDLVAHIPNLGTAIPPTAVKKAIGDRLRANGHYNSLLEEMPRCWRLSYANEFHLDMTPSIPNPGCAAGGELVPDKALREWCASNPKGYKFLFERRAHLTPRIRLAEAAPTIAKGLRAEVEPFPMSRGPKGVLRRAVQILKRHRDCFVDRDPCLAPISVVITTLASQSYEYCVSHVAYDSEFDLLCDIIRHMPAFIETRTVLGQQKWFIWNETTTGENFAEKWNADPRLAEAFFSWHGRALVDIERLANVEELDRLNKSFRELFGSGPANKALAGLTNDISSARSDGRLSVAPLIGVSIAATPRSTSVHPNTFFGKA